VGNALHRRDHDAVAGSGAALPSARVSSKDRFRNPQMVYRGGCGSAWMMSAHPLL